MPEQPTITAATLRKAIAEEHLGWEVSAHLADTAVVPKHALGGDNQGLVPMKKAQAIDFKQLFQLVPTNPLLAERAIARKFMAAPKAPAAQVPPLVTQQPAGDGHGEADAAPGAPVGGAPPGALDWRSRWGWPWITTVRDQNGCNACWAFAATALAEAMERIE